MASMQGKVVAIMGGASGIGLATAKIVHERGASVALADINAINLTEATKQLSQNHPTVEQKITTSVVDVSKSDEVTKWIASVVKDHGKIDCAANVAGVGEDPKDLKDMTDGDWDRTMDTNARGVFNCLRAELKIMTSGGSIVNVASVAGISPAPQIGVYCASKHAVVGLTRTAAKEAGALGVRVNAVAPGVITTPLTDIAKETGWSGLDQMVQMSAAGRWGTGDEVGKVIAFLLSDDASYQTGTVVPVDGGIVC